MERKQKPELSVGGGGILDPDYLPATLVSELELNLNRSPLTADQKRGLLKLANDMAQWVFDDDPVNNQAQREQIEALASCARRLKAAIRMMSKPARDSLNAHTDYLVFGTCPPVLLERHIKAHLSAPDETLLSASWDWANALETSALYTTQQYAGISRQSKPLQSRTRGYLTMLAGYVHASTGQLPPKDRAGWFAGFAAPLTAHFGLEAGPRLLASAIDQLVDARK